MEQFLLLLDGQNVFGPENVIYSVFDDFGADVDDAHNDLIDFLGNYVFWLVNLLVLDHKNTGSWAGLPGRSLARSLVAQEKRIYCLCLSAV